MSETPDIALPDPELIIDFDPPLKHQGLECNQIVLHEPTAKQVETAESLLKNGISPHSIRLYQLNLITSVAGVTRAIIDQMPVTKQTIASEYLERFVRPSRPTGEN